MGSQVNKATREKIERVRLLVLDVDGVLTDGGIIYGDSGEETKRFDVKDGHGMKLLMRAGVDVAIITARTSRVVEHRARNLGIEHLYQGALDKLSAYEELIGKCALVAEETAYMGDDIIDLPVLTRAGFSAAAADAVEEVRERVDYVATRPGGRGAVREVTDLILKVQGRWEEVMERYLR